jgi:hypothetical protein
MSFEELTNQLSTLSKSLYDVLSILSALHFSSGTEETSVIKQEMIESKVTLLLALISLNELYMHSGGVDIIPGSIAIAPKYEMGKIHRDYVVILGYKQEVQTGDEENSLKFNDPDADECFKVVWLRPSNEYEVYSMGMSFMRSQLYSTCSVDSKEINTIDALRKEELNLSNLEEGDIIKYVDISPAFYGLWHVGQVVRIFPPKGGDSDTKLQVKCLSAGDGHKYTMIPRNVLYIQLCSVAEKDRYSASFSSSSRVAHSSSSKSIASCSDSNYPGDSDSEDIITIASYAFFPGSGRAVRQADEESLLSIGAWERHTKGESFPCRSSPLSPCPPVRIPQHA